MERREDLDEIMLSLQTCFNQVVAYADEAEKIITFHKTLLQWEIKSNNLRTAYNFGKSIILKTIEHDFYLYVYSQLSGWLRTTYENANGASIIPKLQAVLRRLKSVMHTCVGLELQSVVPHYRTLLNECEGCENGLDTVVFDETTIETQTLQFLEQTAIELGYDIRLYDRLNELSLTGSLEQITRSAHSQESLRLTTTNFPQRAFSPMTRPQDDPLPSPQTEFPDFPAFPDIPQQATKPTVVTPMSIPRAQGGQDIYQPLQGQSMGARGPRGPDSSSIYSNVVSPSRQEPPQSTSKKPALPQIPSTPPSSQNMPRLPTTSNPDGSSDQSRPFGFHANFEFFRGRDPSDRRPGYPESPRIPIGTGQQNPTSTRPSVRIPEPVEAASLISNTTVSLTDVGLENNVPDSIVDLHAWDSATPQPRSPLETDYRTPIDIDSRTPRSDDEGAFDQRDTKESRKTVTKTLEGQKMSRKYNPQPTVQVGKPDEKGRKFSYTFEQGNDRVHMTSATSPFEDKMFSPEESIDISSDANESQRPHMNGNPRVIYRMQEPRGTTRRISDNLDSSYEKPIKTRPRQQVIQARPYQSRSVSPPGRRIPIRQLSSSSSSSSTSTRVSPTWETHMGCPWHQDEHQHECQHQTPFCGGMRIEPLVYGGAKSKKQRAGINSGRVAVCPTQQPHMPEHFCHQHYPEQNIHCMSPMNDETFIESCEPELEMCTHLEQGLVENTTGYRSSVVLRHVCKHCDRNLQKGKALIRRNSIDGSYRRSGKSKSRSKNRKSRSKSARSRRRPSYRAPPTKMVFPPSCSPVVYARSNHVTPLELDDCEGVDLEGGNVFANRAFVKHCQNIHPNHFFEPCSSAFTIKKLHKESFPVYYG